MNRVTAAALAFASLALAAEPPALHSVSTNFTADLAGTPDGRYTTWGTAESQDHTLVFSPPAGYRVRIIRIYTNFVAAPTQFALILPGTGAEVMWSLLTSSVAASASVSPASEGCLIWVQGLLTASHDVVTLNEDRDVSASGLLGPDNTLVIRMAVALNNTGLLIHMEPTLNVEYILEATQ